MKEFLVSGLRELVERTADEFEPGELGVLTAERAVSEWAAIERIACAAKLRSAARAEDIGLDAEQAVANASGVTSGQARKQTRLRKKLTGKTQTADAFDKGELSTTQADAIADAVEANPDAEQSLLDLAGRASASDLLSECDRVKRDALDADGTLAARQREARAFRSWTDGLGMTCFSGRLEPVAGAQMIAEMERRADRFYRAQVQAKQQTIDTLEQRMADALTEIVSTGSGNGNGKRRGPRTMIQLLVTKAAVERGFIQPGEKCETAQGRPIPMGAVDHALLDPDTKVEEVVFDEVDVRAIISYKRYRPARLQDALNARGRVCAAPGCGRTKGLQSDHTEDFAKGGPTCATNLKWLCYYHHDLKTRGLYRLWEDENGTCHWDPIPRAGKQA
ncbi:MAG: DUF222 domain-containing protein [Actinobacteria bacterium]|nr:DUF222 domain-containing protein [Actinomycetota bacterium]